MLFVSCAAASDAGLKRPALAYVKVRWLGRLVSADVLEKVARRRVRHCHARASAAVGIVLARLAPDVGGAAERRRGARSARSAVVQSPRPVGAREAIACINGSAIWVKRSLRLQYQVVILAGLARRKRDKSRKHHYLTHATQSSPGWPSTWELSSAINRPGGHS